MAQSASPFLLPEPLMKPELWPPLDDAKKWILPLDVATVAGGPLKKRFEDLLERDQAVWFVPSSFFSNDAQTSVQNEIRWREAAGWLKTFPRVRCLSDDPKKIPAAWLKENGWSPDFVESASPVKPNLFSWAKQIFPQLTEEIGEIKLRSELLDYQKKMPTAEEFPWEELRFFAGTLRQKGVALAEMAAQEWAQFQALFSPQNEEVEARKLATDVLILNPTTQILRSAQSPFMILIYRWNDQIHEEQIGWREAYLIDEVSEAPKISVATLMAAVNQEAESLTKVFARTRESEKAKDFTLALESLVAKHVLLRGL